MELTEERIKYVEDFRPRVAKLIAPFESDLDDVMQDIMVKVLEAPDYMAMELNLIISGVAINYKTKQLNRERIERENADEIIKNATPTLSDRHTGGVDEFIDCEQTLSQRWRSLSPFLQTVAKRQFFGYEEKVEKTARDLGTTVAAINMARTRIKQVLNGVKA